MSDWTDKMVKFQKDMMRKDWIRPETFTAVQEWNLQRFVITISESTQHSAASSNNNYPMYHIKAFVRRKNGFYLWNIALIVVSTVVISNYISYCSICKSYITLLEGPQYRLLGSRI